MGPYTFSTMVDSKLVEKWEKQNPNKLKPHNQNILILSTVLKECQRSSGEIPGGHGLQGRVCGIL